MVYTLTRDVVVQSTGFTRAAGRNIGENEIRNQKLWDAWVAEQVVVPVVQEKPVVKEAAPVAPQKGAALEKRKLEVVGDAQLYEMPEDDLRAMAKRLKIKSWHLKKVETLIEEIEGL